MVSSGKVRIFAIMKTIVNEDVSAKQECIAKARHISDALYVFNGKFKGFSRIVPGK